MTTRPVRRPTLARIALARIALARIALARIALARIALAPITLALIGLAGSLGAQAARFTRPTDTIALAGRTIAGGALTIEARIMVCSAQPIGRLFQAQYDQWEDKALFASSGLVGGTAQTPTQPTEFPAGAALSLGTWHHVAFVYDGAEQRLYLDGVRLATRPVTGLVDNFAGSVMSIGAFVEPVGAEFRQSFLGLVDTLRVSSVVRYAGATFAPPAGDLPADPATLACFDFNEPASSGTIADLSGNGHTGTLGAGFAQATAPALGATVCAGISLPAQRSPDSNELNARSNYPFMRANARLQQFYDATATGVPAFAITSALSFRYDGPTATGAATAFTIGRLRIAAGATARPIAALTPVFASNLTAPLTTVFDGAVSFVADVAAVAGPEPWGATGGQFRFPVAAPVAVTVPPGGCFAVELRCENNTNAFLANALIDAHDDFAYGSPADFGSAASFGAGCPAGPGGLPATTVTGGQYNPGRSFSVWGSNLGPGAPVLTWLGLAALPVPLPLPGTSPACTLYVTPDVVLLQQVANATGSIAPFGPASQVVVPPAAGLAGAVFFLQNLAFGLPWAGNPYGVLLADARRITLGPIAGPASGWFVGHHLDANAAVATYMDGAACALRIE